jgi:hypothetical protein
MHRAEAPSEPPTLCPAVCCQSVFQRAAPLQRCTLRLASATRKRAPFFRQSAFSAVGSLELSINYTPLKVRVLSSPLSHEPPHQQSQRALPSVAPDAQRPRQPLPS